VEKKQANFTPARQFSGKTLETAIQALNKALTEGELSDLPSHITITVQGNQLSEETRRRWASMPV